MTQDALNGLLLSESALAKDWLRPEEDVAWAHLQRPNSAQILEKLRKRSFPPEWRRPTEQVSIDILEERNAWNNDF
jgi:hypothetical protein